MAAHSRSLVTLFLLLCLSIQAAASFSRLGERAWPFLNYHMYRKPHYAGDTLYRYKVFGRRADGTEVEIRAEDLGLTFHKFLWSFVDALRWRELSTVRAYAEWHERRFGRALRELRLEDHPVAVTRNGIEEFPPRVLRRVRRREWTARA